MAQKVDETTTTTKRKEKYVVIKTKEKILRVPWNIPHSSCPPGFVPVFNSKWNEMKCLDSYHKSQLQKGKDFFSYLCRFFFFAFFDVIENKRNCWNEYVIRNFDCSFSCLCSNFPTFFPLLFEKKEERRDKPWMESEDMNHSDRVTNIDLKRQKIIIENVSMSNWSIYSIHPT